jgi:hypothetical protein
MTNSRAIRACFTKYQMAQGRKVLQLIFETPLEHQADVFEKLGYPMPDTDRWCGIALLDPDAVSGSRPVPMPAQAPQATASEPGAKNLAKSWVAKEAYRNKSPGEKAVVLASLLIKDAEFQLWAGAQDERHADHMLKVWCGITSKSELADNEAAQTKLNAMRLEFEMAMGRIAEVR